LASRYGVSGYDASHLALALAERLPLATLDKRLAEAARTEKAPLIGPLAP
jgi:predicted nucleic acid-binding protein